MSRDQGDYYAGIAMKPFDLLKFMVVSFFAVFILVILLAAAFGAPYYPAVTNRQIALGDPRTFQLIAAADLAGRGDLEGYGPPYDNAVAGAQTLGFIAPAIWTYKLFGVTYPVDPAQDFVLRPLSMAASLNPPLAGALAGYNGASAARRGAWANNYFKALGEANGDWSAIPKGDYGPVPVMLDGLRQMAVAGLLSGALDRTNRVYRYDVGRDLLFLQGKALHQVAGKLDLKGEQWGIMHDEGPYPGPWWLAPYSFLYQVPPWSTSPSGDLMAGLTMTVLFLILLFLPFIPGLNQLPRYLYIYRIIWRDYYRSPGPAKDG
ncbi:MAG: cytochrome B6 [Peptococcaceae bacterium]|jgi:hypothetical protein|nr:cytochrome B6 [Peptococcaceae bacterium]